ncbi:MAG: nucleotidyltransferase domain-containing protein [bacterium]|nr:nucleotidyltransferase domain-containing protein [bacterium]
MSDTINIESIRKVAAEIAARFSPERIVLFGSRATGTAQPDSDVDLLIVMEYDGKSYRKAAEIRSSLQIQFAMDILVIRPADYRMRLQEFDPIVVSAEREGIVLYERNFTALAV